MADEIRMYASSDFDENAAPTEIRPAQAIELEDGEEESNQPESMHGNLPLLGVRGRLIKIT